MAVACRGGSHSQGCHGRLPGVPEVLRSPANLQDMSSQAHLLPKSLIGNNIAVTLNFI